MNRNATYYAFYLNSGGRSCNFVGFMPFCVSINTLPEFRDRQGISLQCFLHPLTETFIRWFQKNAMTKSTDYFEKGGEILLGRSFDLMIEFLGT